MTCSFIYRYTGKRKPSPCRYLRAKDSTLCKFHVTQAGFIAKAVAKAKQILNPEKKD